MQGLFGLFLTFFKLGAFTFGGGYAMISLIENEVVTKKGWLTRDEMLDIITIAESTPGPLAVNMATFVGTKIKGILGAIVATLGLVIPPFAIICIISLVLNEFKEIAVIAYALKGIQAGVVVLILNAFLKFFKGMDKSIMSYIFLIVTFIIALATDFPVVAIILIGAVLGVSIMAISAHIANKRVVSRDSVTDIDTSNNASSGTLAGGIAENDSSMSGNNEGDTTALDDDSKSGISGDNIQEGETNLSGDTSKNDDDITIDDTELDIDEDFSVEDGGLEPHRSDSQEGSYCDNSNTYNIVSDVDDEEDSDV